MMSVSVTETEWLTKGNPQLYSDCEEWIITQVIL